MPESNSPIHFRGTWTAAGDLEARQRNSVGGYPILPLGESWPVCSEDGCGRKMALFFQFDVDDAFGLPFEAGSTLSVFQCIEHDDPFEPLDALSPKKGKDQLPEGYWQHANYAIFFSKPGAQHQLNERDPHVGFSALAFAAEPEPKPKSVEALNFKDIKVGGQPFFVQRPVAWRCSCGSDMAFVCEVPGNLFFPRVEGGPKQPNGRATNHFLFLGLFAYLFACRSRCDPRAVVAVRQN